VPEWAELVKINDGWVSLHSLLVVWKTVTDSSYAELNDEEKNICLWAALLHDIAKLGGPIYSGKDHIHPFKSAIILLDVFNREGIIARHSDPAY